MYDQVVKCQRAGLCLSEHFLLSSVFLCFGLYRTNKYQFMELKESQINLVLSIISLNCKYVTQLDVRLRFQKHSFDGMVLEIWSQMQNSRQRR